MRICSELDTCNLKHNSPHCDGIHKYSIGCDLNCIVSHKICTKIEIYCGNCGKKDWCKSFESSLEQNRDCLDWIK